MQPLDPGRELLMPEWLVLGMLCAQSSHGWTIVKALDAEGDLGEIWPIERSVVYRASKFLSEHGLIAEARNEPSPSGPNRTLFVPTRAGRKRFEQWLSEPVEHTHDLRPLSCGSSSQSAPESVRRRSSPHSVPYWPRSPSRSSASSPAADLTTTSSASNSPLPAPLRSSSTT